MRLEMSGPGGGQQERSGREGEGWRWGATAPGHVDCRKDSGRFSEGGGRRGRVLSRGMA